MSYILDALKKADAERERSGVPGLHAAAGAGAAADEARRDATRWRAVALTVLSLAGAAALGWWWHGTGESAPTAVLAAAPVPSTPSTAAATPLATTSAPPPTVVVPPAAPVVVPPSAEATAPPARPDADASPGMPRVIVPPAAPTTTAASASGATLPVYPDLPADLKRQLPPLAVNGAVYGPAASGRMVFINGQVVREGDSLAEGLVVERIGPKASVLAWRGTRFELRH